MKIEETRQFFNAEAAQQRQRLSIRWEEICKSYRLSFGKHVRFEIEQTGNYQIVKVFISSALKSRIRENETVHA